MDRILSYFDMLPWFPENTSTFGGELDSLFAIIYWISVGIFFLTFGIMGYFLVKYRYDRNRRGYNYHGNNVVELTWTVLPTILFAFIGLYSDDIWERTKYSSRLPKADVQVLVMGKQFGWQFLYPGADGQYGRNAYTHRDECRKLITALNPFGIDSTDPNSMDDFTTENQFKVPVNANIVMHGSSQDVLHSFFLPHARVKQDVVPGTWMNIWYNIFKTGKFELACAELCGGGHYSMRAEYEVLSKSAYDAWVDKKVAEAIAARSPQPAVAPQADTATVASLTK